ncbi:MAG: potassium transporter Kup, partial [Gemmatimonadetes bacterium]|nr:potassium transporter Kup [Gemmatimonadota bacterium]
ALAFLSANLLKIPHGGWFPLAVGGVLIGVLTSWRSGRRALAEQLAERSIPPRLLIADILEDLPARVPGTAVYMSSVPDGTPPALLHNLKHNRVFHERVVLLSVLTERVPHVRPAERAYSERLGEGVYQVVLRFGFMDDVDVPAALRHLRLDGTGFAPLATSYFLGRESIVTKRDTPLLRRWRLQLFRMLAQNARDAALYFCLPPNRVVELGAKVEI